MTKPTIIMFAVIIALLAASIILSGRLPKPYNKRSCQGKGWKKEFPMVNKNDIREFLAVFVASFAFKNEEKLKFNPQDKILHIYRALYPIQQMPDALELETLAESINMKYGVSLESVWHEELTLGELFKKVAGVGANEHAA